MESMHKENWLKLLWFSNKVNPVHALSFLLRFSLLWPIQPIAIIVIDRSSLLAYNDRIFSIFLQKVFMPGLIILLR